MTPVVKQYTATTNGILTITIDDDGVTMACTGDTTATDFTLKFLNPVPAEMRTQFDTAEDARSREALIKLQACFETEMGQELLKYNNQALVKDGKTLEYTQAVTRIAFDAYQKGLDGCP